MISYASIAIMAVDLLLGIAMPVALAIYLRKRFKMSLKPFFVGCAVWFLFVVILERIMHLLVLGSPVGATIQNNVWYYALYGGLAAGLFEESGRFIAMKTVLKKEQADDRNAILYGAGHGGFEAFFLLSIGMVNNLIYSVLYNIGGLGLITASLDESQTAVLQAAIDKLAGMSPAAFLISPVERIFAIALHIALSLLVWTAVTKKRTVLFPIAIAFHFLVDAIAVILTTNGLSMVLIEAIICLMTAVILLYSIKVFKNSRASC